jgi:hypothetical protein
MKKIVLELLLFFVVNIAFSQTQFTKDALTYEIISENQVKVIGCQISATTVNIPESVSPENSSINYTVTTIGNLAFDNCVYITNITIPNTITKIEKNAFKRCKGLSSITLPNTITSIDSNTFHSCESLTTINIPNTITNISHQAFAYCTSLNSITLPENATIAIDAFYNTGTTITINDVTYGGNDTINVGEDYKFTNIGFITFYLGEETYHTTEASVVKCNKNKIGHFSIPDSITYNNNTYPVTVIKKDAFYNCTKLTSITINKAIKSIETEAFFESNKLDSVICQSPLAPKLGSQVFRGTSISKKLIIPFEADYNTWTEAYDWKRIYHLIEENDTITLANDFTITNKKRIINNGVLKIPYGKQLINQTENNITGIIEIETDILSNTHWSMIGAPFSNYKLDAIKQGSRDVSVSTFDYTTGNWSEEWATIETQIEKGEGFLLWSFAEEKSIFTTDAEGEAENYILNNENEITLTKTLTTYSNGNWIALANPYLFKIDVSKFIARNRAKLQGQDGIYKLNNNGEFQYITQGEINPTEGFFVNYENPEAQTITFAKNQRLIPAKAEKKKEYIKIKMQDSEKETELLFCHNQDAKASYDVFDANKLFSLTETTEPYFLTENIALVKEEVNILPYTATINIRNHQSKEITLSVENIPEGISVFLLDNGYDVKMNNGEKYTTRITEGENANRFQLLVKKAHKIESIEAEEITIENKNREITIHSPNNNFIVKIYNTIGQEIFSTKERNFTLDKALSGAYLIKLQSNRNSKSKKIIIY